MPKKTIPDAKPRLSKAEAVSILKQCLGESFDPNVVTMLGIRDYYLDSMGAPGKGDFDIYDGALAIVAPDKYVTFNFNTDPSAVWKMKGGKRKYLARLTPGVYKFYRDYHGRTWKPPKKKYKALRMYPEGVSVACTRGGKPSKCGAINMHKGGKSTWSDGCQTLPSVQYGPGKGKFLNVLWDLLDRHPNETGSKTVTKAEEKIV